MYKHAYKKNSANWNRALPTTPSNFMKNSFLLNYQKILNLNSYFVSIFFTCCNDMFEKTKYWGKLNLFSLYLLCSVHLLFDRVYSNCLIIYWLWYCACCCKKFNYNYVQLRFLNVKECGHAACCTKTHYQSFHICFNFLLLLYTISK